MTLSVSERGGLTIDSLAGGSTTWYKPKVFQGDLEIAWTVTALKPVGKNNLNFIFHATNEDGSDVLESSPVRTGAYGEYHQFPNYIVTFVGPAPGKGHTRVRRDPGFQLLSEDLNRRAEVGREYEMNLRVHSGEIQVRINGEIIHECTDAHPLTSGRIGIRTWETKLLLSRLSVFGY